MWIFGKKFSEKTKKHFASMKETWETDKNELALCSGNIYIHGKTDIHGKRYNPLSVGYQIQTLEIFSDIVPVSLDIMEALLKDCFVFTHIYNAIDKPPKKRTKYSPKDFSQTNPPFAKSYIAFLNAYNWQGGEYFYNGEDSFVTFTEGIDRPALKAFYDVIEGEYSMGGHIYGFLKNPRNIVGDDYTSIVDFLSKDKHDILMLLVYSHVDLHINLNSEQFDEENVIRIIQEVCKKDGKNLHGVDD